MGLCHPVLEMLFCMFFTIIDGKREKENDKKKRKRERMAEETIREIRREADSLDLEAQEWRQWKWRRGVAVCCSADIPCVAVCCSADILCCSVLHCPITLCCSAVIPCSSWSDSMDSQQWLLCNRIVNKIYFASWRLSPFINNLIPYTWSCVRLAHHTVHARQIKRVSLQLLACSSMTRSSSPSSESVSLRVIAQYMMQPTATHCNTLQHTATSEE